MLKKQLKSLVRNSPLKPLIGFYHAFQDWSYGIGWKWNLRRHLVPARSSDTLRIYYLGVTEHPNLGDLAQYFCIGLWLRKNYPNAEVIEFPSRVVVEPRFNFISRFRNIVNDRDLIVFQSGYTTQDLGGNHDLMHRIIIQNFPNHKIVFMPQTVYFQFAENREESARLYNLGQRTLFLARDRISFETAKQMFPDLSVRLFPDIVTSLIAEGLQAPPVCENKIMICCRNDGEKFYSTEQISQLRETLNVIAPTEIRDTTIPISARTIKKNLDRWIWKTIEEFARYRVVITDRYHGTIFSVIAGTPVIVLKTTDHKVITGAEWFEGHCHGRVRLADRLEDIPELARKLSNEQRASSRDDYFSREFYDRLKTIIDEELK